MSALKEVYERLLAAYGPQQWWPGETPFEVLLGAVLVQNTNWKNVEKAIANLRDQELLDPHSLYDLSVEELEELIRPAGYYRSRPGGSNLLAVVERHDAIRRRCLDQPLAREELLAINGVGPERPIRFCRAGNLPSFVVDTYTLRVFARHGWAGFATEYHDWKDYFESG